MNNKMPRTPFSTPLSGSARETEIRLRNIFSGPKKRPPALFLALMFSVCIFCGNLVSCQVKEAEGPEAEVWVDYFDTGEMPRDKSAEIQLEEYPGVTFRWTQYGITTTDETGEATLIHYGMPIWNVFLCDLNGDGKRELCATVYFGSGITDSHIEVYDYAAGQWYALWDREEYDYALSLEDGQLQVSQWEYQGGPPCQGEPLSVGGLALSSDDSQERDGMWFIAQAAQFPWSDEPDETEQPAPEAPEPVVPPIVDPDPAADLYDPEVCLYRDGFSTPIGPGNWAELFPEFEPEVEIFESWRTDPQAGHVESWSIDGGGEEGGVSAERFYDAEADRWHIYRMETGRSDMYTPRGIRVGATREEVLAAYPGLLSDEKNWQWAYPDDYLWYCANENGLGPYLYFFFTDDVVYMIQMGIQYKY